MYKLKKVFGVISFETRYIKIIIVDASNNDLHCLYFKKVIYSGCDMNGKLNDILGTRRILISELIKVDKFIGNKVKRYILNISNLQISMTNQTIANQGFKSESDIYKYIDEHPYYQGSKCIKHQIIGYVVNGELMNVFPTESEFDIKCINCFIKKDIISEYENLFDKLLINKIDLYTNAFSFADAFSLNGNSLLIDIDDDHCNLVEYNANKEIVSIQNTNFGTNWLKSQLIHKLKFDDDSKIEFLVHNIKYLNNCSNNPIVANYYQDKYLKVKQLCLEDFKKICLSVVKNQINSFDSYLVDKQFDEIKINCSNGFNELYSLAIKLNYLEIKGKKVEMCNESILGLEDEYVTHLFHVLKDISRHYEKTGDIKLTSLDAFFSEEMGLNQFHKNIIIKFGIQSTKIWSKLGDGD